MYGFEWYKNLKLPICPICGKEFVLAPQHAWRIGKTYKEEHYGQQYNYHVKFVCSYSCMRKWEIEEYGPRDRSKYN